MHEISCEYYNFVPFFIKIYILSHAFNLSLLAQLTILQTVGVKINVVNILAANVQGKLVSQYAVLVFSTVSRL